MLFDRFFRDITLGVKRSREWPKVRKEHLKNFPHCACCGGLKGCEVHHVKPFHLMPELELSSKNLITLCERMKCHFVWGHLYSWVSFNSTIEKDLINWNNKIKERP